MMKRLSLLASLLLFLATSVSAEDSSPAWQILKVPGSWESQDETLSSHDGFAWYRCYVKVPEKWTRYSEDIEEFSGSKNLYAQSVSLLVRHVADVHEVFVNGQSIGTTGSFPPEYRSGYEDFQRWKVPPGVLKNNAYNVIAFRVYNEKGEGGFLKEAPVLMGYFTECTLSGGWEFRVGDDPNWAIAAVDEKPKEAVYEEFVISRSQLNRPEKLIRGRKLSPDESMQKMTVSEDLKLDQVLTEPDIAQPVGMTFDERGRLWVTEYRQYPFPAGIKIISRDQYYRAVYDKLSPPPPNHFKGMDRVTVHEDTDGDGTFDRHKAVLDDLNIAVSVAHGRGGFWVMNPPYLMFYPDADLDDVPDGDPIMHIEGFGMQDTHSVPNALRWGPDGWLYFVQGSTVSSNLRTPEMKPDEAIYCESKTTIRYHPETKRIELFTEGGYNAFGFDFDSKGRLFCGQNVGNARAIHNVQGAYYPKGGSNKYGPASNPYTFGTLEKMEHSPETPRFNHTVVRYEETGMPERFLHKLVSVDPLHQNAYLTEMTPVGSTFRTRDVDEPLKSTDLGFRPVVLRTGPDGAVYIGDFYEEFIAHGQHYQGQVDPDTGRVYRLRAKEGYQYPVFNLNEKSTDELVDLLSHPAKWYRQTALRMIGDRKDESVAPRLKTLIQKGDSQLALEALWALNLTIGLDEATARETLSHPDPYVRLWTVRLLGDEGNLTTELASRLIDLAEQEPHVEVRSQLASTAKRLPGEQAIPILEALYTHDEDIDDPHIPLLIWWGIERFAETHRAEILQLFEDSNFANQPLVTSSLLSRLMKRYALAGDRADLQACVTLLKRTKAEEPRQQLLSGFEEAYRGRSLSNIPRELAEELTASGGGSIVLRMRMGDESAMEQALALLSSPDAKPDELTDIVAVIGELRNENALESLLSLLRSTSDGDLQIGLLSALRNYADDRIGEVVMSRFPSLATEPRQVAETLLVSRAEWSKALLAAVEAGKVNPADLPTDTVRKMLIHQDPEINRIVGKYWEQLQDASSEQIQKQIAHVEQVLSGEAGDLYRGRDVYMETCAKCHVLFTDGKRVGPELTQYKRDDRLRMVINVVNPSAEIREGYENYLVLDIDGRVTTGFLVDQDEHVVVLRGADGQDVTIARDDIEEMIRQPKSLMPEGLLDKLTDQQIRDLFAYLQTGQPLPK